MQKIKKYISSLLSLIITLSLLVSATPVNVSAAAKKGTIKSIKVTNLPANTLTLKKGKSKKLKVKVTTKGKISKAVTFKSSNTKIVTVNSKGVLKAKKKGKAKVSIVSKGNKKKKLTIQVTVGVPVTKLTLNKKNIALSVGDSTSVKATALPKKASNKAVIWTTANKKVAVVSKQGVISAKKEGTTKITAIAKDGSGKKAVVTVSVKRKAGKTDISSGETTETKPDATTQEPPSDHEEEQVGEQKENLENLLKTIGNLEVSEDDEEYAAILQKAREAAKDSSDPDKLEEQIQILQEWLDDYYQDALSIDIAGDGLSGFEYDGEESLNGEAIVYVSGYSKTCPELKFTVPETSSIKEQDDPSNTYEKIIIVTTSDGKSCTYKISYSKDENSCGIEEIVLNKDENNILTYWEEGEELTDGSRVLKLEGDTEEFEGELLVTPSYDKAVVSILTSDKSEYVRKVIISNEEHSQTYYISYNLDRDQACDISSVEAMEGDADLITDWDKEFISDDRGDEDYWALSIYGCADAIPENINYIPAYEDAVVKITDSDKEGYINKITITKAESQRIYYVKYLVDEDYVLGVDSLSAKMDEEELLTGFEISKEEELWVLDVNGTVSELPSGAEVGLTYGKAKSQFMESDQSGYDKKLVVTCDEKSRTYYIRYHIDEDRAMDIQSIEAVVEGTDILTSWSVEDEGEHQVISLYGLKDEIPYELNVTTVNSAAKVEVANSDIAGFDKKLTISFGDKSNEYYIRYNLDEEIACGIEEVKAIDAETEENYISFFDIDTVIENDAEFWILKLQGTTDDIPEELAIEPVYDEAEIDLDVSDKEGYVKKATIKAANFEREYYISYQIDEDIACGIASADITLDEENILTSFETEEVSADEERFWVLSLRGMAENIENDYIINIEPAKEGATVKTEESDKNGYLKKVEIIYGKQTRSYYLTYDIDEDYIFEIDKIESLESQEDMLVSYDILPYEDEEGNTDYWIIQLYGINEHMPENCVLTPAFPKAMVTEGKSDMEAYDRKYTLSYGDKTRTYYVEYHLDEEYACDISDVEAILDEENIITDFSLSMNENEGEGTAYWILALKGKNEDMPEEITVEPTMEKAEVIYENSDLSGYQKRIIIGIGEVSRTYYVSYEMDENYMFSIEEVSYTKNGEEQITSFDTVLHEDGEGNADYWILKLFGVGSSMPSELNVILTQEKASYKADVSKKELTVTYGNKSRVYKLEYQLDMEYLCGIDSIEATAGEEDEENLITGFDLEPKYKSEDGSFDYWILTITGKTDTLPSNLTVVPSCAEATVAISNTDVTYVDGNSKVKYLKRIAVKYNNDENIMYKYFVKYVKE